VSNFQSQEEQFFGMSMLHSQTDYGEWWLCYIEHYN